MSDHHSVRPRVAKPVPDDERGWLGMMVDLCPFPALVVDLESGEALIDNPAARDIPLRPPAEGHDGDDYFVERDGARIDPRDLARAIASPATAPGGVEVSWHARGREFDFRVFCRRLPAADGLAPLAFLTFLDITDRRATEWELRRALEVRDEFFSIATHELKDPLFSLQLANQLLRRALVRHGEIPAQVVHHLDVSRRQTERLSGLVDNLLDVSRIMNRRIQLDIEALDLADLVQEAAGRFRERAESSSTPVVTEIAGPIIGYFDRQKIEQVLGNLLSNAFKYGGGRPVTVRVHADEETAVLEVEDQGAGIAPEDQARIFGRFERASKGYRKESLGLGLYIVRSLVEAHGGSIGVRSEPGRGATFTVTLPRKRLPVDEGPSAAGSGHGPNRG
ncbi:Sensor protein SrrB [Aquisphaera giovannonii]|uniref:histidine kinase n=1 Tax=Aquisphaera giovannonii TaxID=406548 RepID=A0A5B9WAX8_9BACT|nr:PAS domain-containing sensor histidine kinase [Aquisphaera giovannonii]QEH37627.1 Sensor protein SrrB [Aquisphaera giovannonii]